MNKLLLGYFYPMAALLIAGNFSPAPELIERARGYAHKQVQFKIRYEDGIDRAEAFALAERKILGAIDSQRLPVQRYDDRPIKDGDFWRINIFIKTSKGLKKQPLLVDSITGTIHGVPYKDGWYNVGGDSVDLGSSKYQIERNRVTNSLSVEVTLNRMTESNDLAARQECYRDAVRAIAKIKQNFLGKFEDVPLKAIVMSEHELADTYGPDRQWNATFPLRQKRSVRSRKIDDYFRFRSQ